MTFPTRDRLHLFLRSLSIQGSWNFPRMQGLGYFYSLLPWLRKVSGSGFKEACYRHLAYFNTNPYMSPYILGVVAHMEEEGRGPESVRARDSLMGPLGAMGDGYYWANLLPATLLFSIAASFFWMWAAPLLFLLLYNAVHIWNRWSYLGLGYRKASSPLEGASELNGRLPTRVLEGSVTPLLGFILGVAAFGTGTPGTALLLFVVAFLLFRRQWRSPGVFAFLAFLGTLLGLLGSDMGLPW